MLVDLEHKRVNVTGGVQGGLYKRFFHLDDKGRRTSAIFLTDACPSFVLESVDCGFCMWAAAMIYTDCVLLEPLTPLLYLYDLSPSVRRPPSFAL